MLVIASGSFISLGTSAIFSSDVWVVSTTTSIVSSSSLLTGFHKVGTGAIITAAWTQVEPTKPMNNKDTKVRFSFFEWSSAGLDIFIINFLWWRSPF